MKLLNKKTKSTIFNSISKKELIRQYTIQHVELSPDETKKRIKEIELAVIKPKCRNNLALQNEYKAELSALYRIRQIQNKLIVQDEK